MYEQQSFQLLKHYRRTVLRVSPEVHHLQPEAKHYNPDKVWIGIEWPNGLLGVTILTDEEAKKWLRGEPIADPEPEDVHHSTPEE